MAAHHDCDERARNLFDWLTTIFLERYAIVPGIAVEYDPEDVMGVFFVGSGLRDEVTKPGRGEIGGFEIEIDDVTGYSFDILELGN
jgi:hypothetical protein